MISDAAKNAMKIFHPSQGLDEALDDWIDRGDYIDRLEALSW